MDKIFVRDLCQVESCQATGAKVNIRVKTGGRWIWARTSRIMLPDKLQLPNLEFETCIDTMQVVVIL